ncbi:hypothetical protein AVEN_147148-1 [Araneus ventricosus]|uniref:Uncharacterized protein n=1 Tax=Araneus ventricosus TaxID=182803 RepID=A0A4Y2UDD6_ARAVE|nr:hypothetical protein AVEN_230065-1 [Araneus ventricosus]GBO10125.1 hypothetical protein AVEN_147148-1 [Araneus ventricosus]
MAFLAKAQKVDLLSLAAEVGLDVSPNLCNLELIKLIQSSADYEQETFKDILKAVTSTRIQKEKEEREFVTRKPREDRELAAKKDKRREKRRKKRENLWLKREKD